MISIIRDTIINTDFNIFVNNVFNAVMTGNMNIYTNINMDIAANKTKLLLYEQMRIYGGGCVDCPTKMPTNHTYVHISSEEERDTWLIILAAFLSVPCLGFIILICRFCYFTCKERVCKCGDDDENNHNLVAHNV